MDAMSKRGLTWWNIMWLVLATAYFLIPLYGAAEFSLETGHGHYGFDAYQTILTDPQFKTSFIYSLKLAIATVILELALMVPTIYWVNLKLPRLRKVVEFIAILPIVVPPIALTVGILKLFQNVDFISSGPQILVLTYVILALPFTYRSLDAGFRAIDIKILTDAAQSLGAGGVVILWRVILPNLRQALFAASFLTLALVMGEYTVASLMQFTDTFAVYVFTTGNAQAQPAAALSIISLLLTWAAMLGILFLGRGPGRQQVNIGGTR
jgi:putative spermidine/putrescine transport system permease protein